VNKSWILFKRDCLTRVKTKGFIIGTLIFPVFVLLLLFLPGLFMQMGNEGTRRIAVIDFTGRLAAPLVESASEIEKDATGKSLYTVEAEAADSKTLESVKRTLNRKILDGRLDAFMVLSPDIFDSNRYELYAKNISNFQLNRTLNDLVTGVVSRIRLSESGLNPEIVKRLNQNVWAKTFKVAETGAKEESGELAFLISYAMAFMIYMVLIFYGSYVMRGVIEDKSSRVIEVLLSSARPHQIMTGKILGIGAAGLIQMSVWTLCLLFASTYGVMMVKQFAPATQGVPIPSVSVWTLLAFVLFFLIGYFMYSTVYAAMGSVGNAESEMQNLQWWALAPIMISFFLMFAIGKNPEGTLAVVLSLFPLFSPILMMYRISVQAAPLYQVILCIALCLVSIAGMVWLSGRIFRIGILMYGKRPTLPEVMKWIRYS
jgi:ABC-2 type transport system permease protein